MAQAVLYACCNRDAASPCGTVCSCVQVPMDQGEHALQMLEHLTRDQPFFPSKREALRVAPA